MKTYKCLQIRLVLAVCMHKVIESSLMPHASIKMQMLIGQVPYNKLSLTNHTWVNSTGLKMAAMDKFWGIKTTENHDFQPKATNYSLDVKKIVELLRKVVVPKSQSKIV